MNRLKLPEWKDVDFQMDECPLSAQYSELKWSHYGTRWSLWSFTIQIKQMSVGKPQKLESQWLLTSQLGMQEARQ